MSKHQIVIRADWDEEAQVWVASSGDIDGLSLEAESLELLRFKLTGALSDLFELNGISGVNGNGALVELVARSRLHIPAAA